MYDDPTITAPFSLTPEAEELLGEAAERVRVAVEKAFGNGVHDVESLEREVRSTTGKFVSERTRRRPMIVPVVIEA